MMRAGSAPRPGSPRGAIEAQAQRISVFGSGEIVLVSNTPQDVSWNNENYKFEITHSNVTNPEDITVEVAGRYLITASASFAFDDVASGAEHRVLPRYCDGPDGCIALGCNSRSGRGRSSQPASQRGFRGRLRNRVIGFDSVAA